MLFILFVGRGNSLANAEVLAQISHAIPLSDFTYQFNAKDQSEAIKLVGSLGSSLKLLVENPEIKPNAPAISQSLTQKNFSISYLESTEVPTLLIREIKSLTPKSRYVEAKTESGVSPVVYVKQKIDEFFISQTNQSVYQTIWVHDFDHWIKKDRHLPGFNPRAGMLPPKIARSMINLVPLANPQDKLLVDPFCGSGRVLVEASELGYQVFGTDIVDNQVSDALKNLQYLNLEGDVKVYDAVHLSDLFQEKIDLIVTEPYLGKPNLRPDRSKYAKSGLSKLYLGALKDWYKALKTGGYVVMVFPILPGINTEYKTSQVIDAQRLLGYNQLTRDLIYSRPEAGIKREIVVLQKK